MKLHRMLWSRWKYLMGERVPLRSKWRIRVGCTLLTLGVAIIGLFAKGHADITELYAIPVAIIAWFVDATSAIVLSILSVAIFLLTVGSPGPLSVPSTKSLGIALFRFSFFGITSVVMARLSHLQHNLQSLAEARAKALAAETSNRERLEREMLEISEREQRRIGQDLHDGLCQLLTGAALAGHPNARLLQADGKAVHAERALKAVNHVEEAILLAKSIANGLDPVELQRDGLMEALEEFAATTSDLFGIECRFECQVPVLVDSPQAAVHLYRIAQEAVGNAVKHGRATIIDITLDETEAGTLLSIVDNGCGFVPKVPSAGGRGLRTMTVRARLIGGKISIRQSENDGMEVICAVPAELVHA
jgi:signal transduction histidine kinase